MQCLKHTFAWWSTPLLGGAPKSLQDWFTKGEEVEEARPEEAAMVPVEGKEALLAAVEDGAVVAVETAKEPEALNSLQSCGGHWQSQCLQTPPCQKHAVAAAFMQMVVAEPKCLRNLFITPKKKKSFNSPPSREQCVEWGKKGAEKRKAWLEEHQGELKKYSPRLTQEQKAKCLKQVKEQMPPAFSHPWKEKTFWREQAAILKVTVTQLKNCWEKGRRSLKKML